MNELKMGQVTDALGQLVASVVPGARLLRVLPLRPDEGFDAGAEDATAKAIGYGVPLRLVVGLADGSRKELCLHTAQPDEFGHDRRADRAANMLLSFDTFGKIPRHVRALDVGAVLHNGGLTSLRESGEFYLVTEFVEGHVYAEDLRRIASTGVLLDRDIARAASLARLLVEIHSARVEGPALYRRAVRDLVGHGEGIFGLVDGFPDDVPMAPPSRLFALEDLCLSFRHRLRASTARLTRTHGDFHPFNILFDDKRPEELRNEPIVLDTSRGSVGDPADDVTCLALNYVFFALEAKGTWQTAFSTLWRTFFETYFQLRPDNELFSVAPPFLAWRALVMANPRWYPSVHATTRDSLLGFVERALSSARFDPTDVEGLFL